MQGSFQLLCNKAFMPLAIDVDCTRCCAGAVYLEIVNAWFGPGPGVLVCAGC